MAKRKAKKSTKSNASTETKSEKFLRLAPPRVIRVLNSMRSLRKLANRNSYDWNEDQAHKILAAIVDEANKLQDALNATATKKESVEFEF